jgi:hypothetical protein
MFAFAIDVRRFAAASHRTLQKISHRSVPGANRLDGHISWLLRRSNPLGQKSSATQADVKNNCRVVADRRVAAAASNRTLAIQTSALENTPNATIPRVMSGRTLLQSGVRRLWYARQVGLRIRRR